MYHSTLGPHQLKAQATVLSVGLLVLGPWGLWTSWFPCWAWDPLSASLGHGNVAFWGLCCCPLLSVSPSLQSVPVQPRQPLQTEDRHCPELSLSPSPAGGIGP